MPLKIINVILSRHTKATHHSTGGMVAICVCMLLMSVSMAFAASPTSHFIIAFDQTIGSYAPFYQSPQVLKKIETEMKSRGFNPDRDYVSVVAYQMELGNPDMNRFVRPFKSHRQPVLWKKLGPQSLNKVFDKWPYGQPKLENPPFASMQSLVKPYIVRAASVEKYLATTKDKTAPSADNTYLFIATDEVVNGVDDNYASEWNSIGDAVGTNKQKYNALKDDVFAQTADFFNHFSFYQDARGDRVPLSPDGHYKLVIYQLIPTVTPSIHSATDYPSPLPLRRVRGGYKISAEGHPTSDMYQIRDVVFLNHKGDTIGKSDNPHIDVRFSSGRLHRGDTIVAKVAMEYKDGYYDGLAISANNPRYKNGMTLHQEVRLPDEAKVLGLLPLADPFWWWYPDDVTTAVMIWDILIVLILVAAILYGGYALLKRFATYVPDDKDIHIRHL